MEQLLAIKSKEDILREYRDTPIGKLLEYHNLDRPVIFQLEYRDILVIYPIGKLLEYHNLDRPFDVYPSAQLLVGMCMDHRKHLHMPDNFAYIIRTGGANLRYSEFKVSYAI